jgi:uncharacterized protein YbjT (DUF2867 family)
LGVQNFARAALAAGVRRIVYLGGLGDQDSDLSPHLRSRHEVGRALRASGVPVIEFRASIVLGSGSLSFEMLSALVERLPAMVTLRWVQVTAQPIAISDLLAYLEAALDLETEESRIYEIGGADRVSYGGLMREYARLRGLRRVMVPVPVLTPRLSSLWLGLVTPLYARVGRDLIESICHETVVRDDRARRDFMIEPIGVQAAIANALANEDREFAETRWSDAISAGGTDPGLFGSYGGVRRGRRLTDSRECEVDVPPAEEFAPIRRIGGRAGWYAFDWLWRLRGFLDLLVGGVGVRRGRRDSEQLHIGDSVDWWRVESYEPDPPSPPPRRDESARSGLARVRGKAHQSREHDSADGRLRAHRPGRPLVLVRDPSTTRGGLRRHAGRDRAGGAARSERIAVIENTLAYRTFALVSETDSFILYCRDSASGSAAVI